MQQNASIRIASCETEEMVFASLRVYAAELELLGINVEREVVLPVAGTKGASLPTGLLVKVAEATIAKLIEVATAVFNRPGAPTAEIEIKIGASKASIKFDPRTLRPDQIPSLVKSLRSSIAKG